MTGFRLLALPAEAVLSDHHTAPWNDLSCSASRPSGTSELAVLSVQVTHMLQPLTSIAVHLWPWHGRALCLESLYALLGLHFE